MIPPVDIIAMISILLIAPGEDRLKSVERGILWQVSIDAADTVYQVIVNFNGFAHGVAVAEECRGQGFGNDDGRWIFYGIGSSIEHPEAKHPGKVRLRNIGDPANRFLSIVEKATAVAEGHLSIDVRRGDLPGRDAAASPAASG